MIAAYVTQYERKEDPSHFLQSVFAENIIMFTKAGC